MRHLIRRSQGLVVALVALALTAGAAFAGGSMPSAASSGLSVAAEAAGKVVPVVQTPDSETEEPAEEEPAEEEPAEVETDDPGDDAADAHGAVVSEAAGMDTPEGFDTHGQFVSCVARMPHGDGDPAIDLTKVTSETCDAAGPGKSAGKGKPETAGPETHGASATGKAHGR